MVAAIAVLAAAFVFPAFGSALAQQAVALDGPPIQVVPMYPEPGVPMITINPGARNPFPGSGTGTGTTGGDGSGDGSGAGSSGTVSGSSALNTMLSTPWGITAVDNAEIIGINPSALAGTCVMESGCQNIGGSGSITGAFQMTGSTYTAMINAAVAQNPQLASQIVPGIAGQNDPATQSIAASEYLLQGAQSLQTQGITNPSVVDVRGFYNFGPGGGAAIANATSEQTMASVLSMYSPSTLAKNGITPGETVGQWQAGVTAKIGNAATQNVIT